MTNSGLLGNLDSSLVQRARAVAVAAASGQLPGALAASTGDATVVQVVGTDGRVVAATGNIDGEHRLFGFPVTGDAVVLRAVADVPLDETGSYRVAGLAATTPTGPVTTYAGRPTAEIGQSIGELVVALTVGVPLLAAFLGLAAWLLLGWALRPVEAMRRQASTISGTDLHRRLAPPGSAEELRRLAATFNDLLGRIESAIRRQRQFVADAAHELRSPVAALRAQLDIEARHAQLPISPADRHDLAADAERLSRLVDDLLALARLDAHPRPRREPVDLDDLVLREVRRAQGRTTHRINARGVSGARVLGDTEALDRVVQNLLDNAIRHASATVTVGLSAAATTVTLSVADDGTGIPAADRDRVFERFIRLDTARNRNTGGSGLGLAIVRDVLTAHHGDVRVEDNQPGARLIVTLPAAADPLPAVGGGAGARR